jgi:hypothetical protein
MAKGNAENLRDILELARLRRLNGIMTIEHKKAGKVEEGEVFFQTGQPIQARIGRLAGQDALSWIMKWHNITYSIGTDESIQSIATSNVSFVNNATSSPIPTYAPSNGMASTEPVVAQKQVNGRSSILSNTSTPGIEWLAPHKLGIEREVLALPLTRRQRFIYFLVDGRRTIADLARCTGKNTQEIELILSELQEQGLIAV